MHTLGATVTGHCALTVECSGARPVLRALFADNEHLFMVCRVINMDVYCCFVCRSRGKGTQLHILGYSSDTQEALYRVTKPYLLNWETIFKNQECAFFSHKIWNLWGEDLLNEVLCAVDVGECCRVS